MPQINWFLNQKTVANIFVPIGGSIQHGLAWRSPRFYHNGFQFILITEQMTPLANTPTLSSYIDTFSPPFCKTTKMDVIQAVQSPLF